MVQSHRHKFFKIYDYFMCQDKSKTSVKDFFLSTSFLKYSFKFWTNITFGQYSWFQGNSLCTDYE